jgi:hypothetical protein
LRRGAAAKEQVAQDPDRIGKLDLAVVIRIPRISAGVRAEADEKAVEGLERIADIQLAAPIGVPSHEAHGGGGRGAQAPQKKKRHRND